MCSEASACTVCIREPNKNRHDSSGGRKNINLIFRYRLWKVNFHWPEHRVVELLDRDRASLIVSSGFSSAFNWMSNWVCSLGVCCGVNSLYLLSTTAATCLGALLPGSTAVKFRWQTDQRDNRDHILLSNFPHQCLPALQRWKTSVGFVGNLGLPKTFTCAEVNFFFKQEDTTQMFRCSYHNRHQSCT